MSAYSRGTSITGLAVQLPDGGSVSYANSADANGEFRTTQNYNISSGTYSAITLEGIPTTKDIVTEVTMQGTKTGPDNGQISFAIDGITHGTATVTVYVDGGQALSRAIVIGTAPSTGSSGSSGTPGSPGIGAPTTGPATTASTDGKVSLTGTNLEGAGLLAVAVQGTVPAGWSLSGKIYAVTPEGREFDPAAVISFRLPSADATATLARYGNGAWTPVPSKVEGDRITATVTRAGSYTLLVPVTTAAPVATTTAADPSATTTGGSVTTTSGTPVTTTPPAAPVTPLLPVIALAIFIIGWKRRS